MHHLHCRTALSNSPHHAISIAPLKRPYGPPNGLLSRLTSHLPPFLSSSLVKLHPSAPHIICSSIILPRTNLPQFVPICKSINCKSDIQLRSNCPQFVPICNSINCKINIQKPLQSATEFRPFADRCIFQCIFIGYQSIDLNSIDSLHD